MAMYRVYKLLMDKYIDAIEDAQSMWLSDYCGSPEEAEERKKEDEEKIQEFLDAIEVIKRRMLCLTHTKN